MGRQPNADSIYLNTSADKYIRKWMRSSYYCVINGASRHWCSYNPPSKGIFWSVVFWTVVIKNSFFHLLANMDRASVTIAASMGLSNLQHEPQRLTSEADRLNAELESLVMDNYKIFVENLTCSVNLRTEVSVTSEQRHIQS